VQEAGFAQSGSRCYGSRLVPRPLRHWALASASVGAIGFGLLLPSTGGADSASSLRQKASALQSQNASLSAQSHSALVQMYALQTQLDAARARLASIQSQVASVRDQQASARYQLRIDRRALRVTQRRLRERLVFLYESQQPDALATFLGASSLGEANDRTEAATSIAGQDRSIVQQTRRTRVSLRRLTHALAVRAARLESLQASAEQAAAALESARAAKADFIAGLSAQRSSNSSRISSLESEARQAESRSRQVAAQQAVNPVPAPSVPTPAPSGPGQAITVVATAYDLPGTTATGVPVGPGIVAVDPNVIPLGTRMTIPGYGEGVAADTGSAIIGNRIDVWVPSGAAASTWGVRTVTITLH
jgi:3D (Asp-Asp-Asp) domain-containing protein/peptidoglycan hydrolase CwlO-like protein